MIIRDPKVPVNTVETNLFTKILQNILYEKVTSKNLISFDCKTNHMLKGVSRTLSEILNGVFGKKVNVFWLLTLFKIKFRVW